MRLIIVLKVSVLCSSASYSWRMSVRQSLVAHFTKKGIPSPNLATINTGTLAQLDRFVYEVETRRSWFQAPRVPPPFYNFIFCYFCKFMLVTAKNCFYYMIKITTAQINDFRASSFSMKHCFLPNFMILCRREVPYIL